MPIYYICDGERSCKNSIGCGFNKNRIYSDCFHTKDEKHARYGKCEGIPEWYPERFVNENGRPLCGEEGILMFIKKREYEALKEEKESAFRERGYYKGKSEIWENNWMKINSAYAEEKKKVEELQKKNEELQHKIDILYAYYDIQKEPTQEERTKIRLDLRVHELEMENLELRAAVNAQIGYLRNDLNWAMLSTANSIYQAPWPYCNLNASLIRC